MVYTQPLTKRETQIARTSKETLSRYARKDKPLKVRVVDQVQAETIELPSRVVSVLMEILSALASGKGITVIPVSAELTTVQAADILNVSRPFLIKLLEEDKIPYRMVGKHRRIRMNDVMTYKQKIDQKRKAILDQLVADAQEQDMGYE